MKTLLFTPLHPLYGVLPETLASITAVVQSSPDVHVMLWGSQRQYNNPNLDENANNNQDIRDKYNIGRAVALSQGFEAMLTIEADMIVPPDTLARLIALDADIALGVYCWRWRPSRWSVYTELNQWGGKSVTFDPAFAVRSWGEPINAVGTGLGCTLIKRRVLEALPFRLFDSDPRHLGIVASDWALSCDAQQAGYRQRADLGLVCGHVDLSKGVVYWPDPIQPEFYKGVSYGN